MTAHFSLAQIEHFKVVAKRTARARGIPHHAALDEVAVSNGFKNWSLLICANRDSPTASVTQAPWVLERDDDSWRAALRTVKGANAGQPSCFPQLRAVCAHFTTPAQAVQFAIHYMNRLLTFPRYWVRPDSQVQAEMRWWLPYSIHEVCDGLGSRVLLNRHYKPVGLTSREFVEYEDFPSLHCTFGLHALRRFSDRDGGTGYLYDEGTAPWVGRSEANNYLCRLRALHDVCAKPLTDDIPWSRRCQEVYERLRPWAGISTWFTAHGHDERRLAEVVDKMQRWQEKPTYEELRAALFRHRNENSELLGGKAPEQAVMRFAQRISEMVASTDKSHRWVAG